MKRKRIITQVVDQVWDQIRSQVDSQVTIQIFEQTIKDLGYRVWIELEELVYVKIRSQVLRNVNVRTRETYE